jgi:uncharacterized membrane protein
VESKEREHQVRVTQVEQRTFSGPLPAPEVLEHYQRIDPGLVERIVSLAEQEADHRRALERTAIRETSAQVMRGQLYGLLIGAIALASVIICALSGAEWAASVLGGSTILGLVAVFVTGRLAKPD